jgi:hypothetical protein
MNNMPNADAPDCGCKWFERAAKDDSIPVVFDELMNEYRLIHKDNRGHSLFWHCPFCGGKAPKSLSSTFWTQVSHEESIRLQKLTRDIKTPDDLFAAFGTPDSDFEVSGSFTTPETEESPSETTLGPRRVVFKSLSDTVDVHVRIDRYDRLKFSYMGRYIGPNRSEQGGGGNSAALRASP